jgi:ABC-2 type transport system permease protein
MMARLIGLLRHEIQVSIREPLTLIVLFLLPPIVILFYRPAAAAILHEQGLHSASGAEQAVPGMAVMFSLFLVGHVGYSILQEHTWGTWSRLRAGSGPFWHIFVGKAAIPFALAYVQLGTLLALGTVAFGLNIRGSVAALMLLMASLSLSLVAIGFAVASFCTSPQQLSVAANVAIVLGGSIGGAFIPIRLIPSWARHIAPISPAYWAMSGFRAVIVAGTGVGGVIRPSLILALISSVAAAIALHRFRVGTPRRGWES